jgi:hypothetical protein
VLDLATREVKQLEATLDTIRDDINVAKTAMNARDVTQMDTSYRKLTQDVAVANASGLFTGQTWTSARPKCIDVANFERTQFDRLKAMGQHLKALLQFDRDHPGDLSGDLQQQRNDLVGAWNTTIGQHNDDFGRLDQVVQDCLNALA